MKENNFKRRTTSALSLRCNCWRYKLFVLQWPVQYREKGESQQIMGVSGQLYHLPLPSDAEPPAMKVDLRDGPASDMGNTSATTFAGKLVGDSITVWFTELNEGGLELIAGSTIFSWVSKVADLKGVGTLKTSRYINLWDVMIFGLTCISAYL